MTKSFSQNVVIWSNSEDITSCSSSEARQKPFMCLLWIDFVFVLEKLQSCCLTETSQSSKYCLKTVLNHWLFVSSLKVPLVMVYSGICDRMSLHQEESRHQSRNLVQICAVSEVLGGAYCNHNADSGTKTDRIKLIFIW